MRPTSARSQDERHRTERCQIVEAGAEFTARIVCRHGVVGKPEAAAALIGLAIARCVEPLSLNCRIGRDADNEAVCRHAVAIAGFESSAVALPVKARAELVA